MVQVAESAWLLASCCFLSSGSIPLWDQHWFSVYLINTHYNRCHAMGPSLFLFSISIHPFSTTFRFPQTHEGGGGLDRFPAALSIPNHLFLLQSSMSCSWHNELNLGLSKAWEKWIVLHLLTLGHMFCFVFCLLLACDIVLSMASWFNLY